MGGQSNYTCPHCEEEFGDDAEFFEHESVCGGNINNAVEMYQQQESGNVG